MVFPSRLSIPAPSLRWNRSVRPRQPMMASAGIVWQIKFGQPGVRHHDTLRGASVDHHSEYFIRRYDSPLLSRNPVYLLIERVQLRESSSELDSLWLAATGLFPASFSQRSWRPFGRGSVTVPECARVIQHSSCSQFFEPISQPVVNAVQ